MTEDQPTTEPGVTSRRALLVSAGAVGATTVLAACGGDDPGTPGTNPPPANNPATTAPAGSAGGTLAKTSEIPDGGGKVFAAQGVVVTQPSAGEFKAFSATCTHQGCPVAGVDGGTINCTCHGSKFSIEDGSVKNGPATKPLEAKDITVDGDGIVLA